MKRKEIPKGDKERKEMQFVDGYKECFEDSNELPTITNNFPTIQSNCKPCPTVTNNFPTIQINCKPCPTITNNFPTIQINCQRLQTISRRFKAIANGYKQFPDNSNQLQ